MYLDNASVTSDVLRSLTNRSSEMQRKRTGTHALSIPEMKEQVVYISHDIYIRVTF